MKEAERPSLLGRIFKAGGITLSIVLILGLLIGFAPNMLTIGIFLVLGWITFILERIPQVQFAPATIITGVLTIILCIEILHHLVKWYLRERSLNIAWHRGKSTLIVFTLGVLFTAGTASIGIVHQSIWFAKEPKWDRSIYQEAETQVLVQNMVLLTHIYYRDHGRLPDRRNWSRQIHENTRASDLDAWGNKIRYRISRPLTFEFRSAGPDYVMDTEDDIVAKDTYKE